MTDLAPLAALSRAATAVARGAAPSVAGVDWGGRHHISGIVWQSGVLVTSEQSLPDADGYGAILRGGARVSASVAGRDTATNVAVLRLAAEATPPSAAEPDGVGALVLAVGSDGAGDITARLGGIEKLGPAWESMRGGRIDRLLRLGFDIAKSAEGGPVLDATGGLLGMSTFGPRGSVLVIPTATIARVLALLLQNGRIPRGWLGAGLHSVALPRDLADRSGAQGGLMVVNLAEGAPAAAALMPGDILLDIAGTPVMTPRCVASALGPDTIGKPLTLKFLRGGAVTTATVTVAARPE